jgi:hypothetical protein
MIIMAKENEAKLSKLAEKKEQAEAKKSELTSQIEELKTKITDEKDEKAKAKLRKERDELITMRENIVISDDKVKIPMAKSMKKKLTACISIVVVLALLLTYVVTGAAKHGFISSLGWPQKALTGMVLTDNDGKKHAIKVSTYNYYFANYYNNLKQYSQYYSQLGSSLGSNSDYPDFETSFKKQTHEDEDGKKQTWAEFAEKTVLDNIESVYTYYYAAIKANDGKEPEITDEQKDEIKDTVKEYKEAADKNGFTLSAFLLAVMGDGVDLNTLENELKISYISQNYQEDYTNELNKKEYTEEQYKTYRDEHLDDLQSVDVKYFECSNEDDAKAFIKALEADGSNFAALASKYSESDFDKEANKDEVETTYYNMTSTTLKGLNGAIAKADEHEHSEEEEHEHHYEGIEWLYSSKRKAGDMKNFSTSVVYVLKPVYLSDVTTVNVRHILVQAEHAEKASDDSKEAAEPSKVNLSEATKKEAAAAEKKAKKILKEYNDGAKTEDSFAALAKQYSSDGNASEGGLYENVIPNQMVPTFNAWIFDSSRKAGDTAIVKTEFGYHIMYFVSKNDTPAWQFSAQQALASEDATTVVEAFEEANTLKKSWPGYCFYQLDTDIDN